MPLSRGRWAPLRSASKISKERIYYLRTQRTGQLDLIMAQQPAYDTVISAKAEQMLVIRLRMRISHITSPLYHRLSMRIWIFWQLH